MSSSEKAGNESIEFPSQNIHKLPSGSLESVMNNLNMTSDIKYLKTEIHVKTGDWGEGDAWGIISVLHVDNN